MLAFKQTPMKTLQENPIKGVLMLLFVKIK
jgi:hypothetical protein